MSQNRDIIEIIASALVREYLARKQFTHTLKHLELEYPRCEGSITSRHALARALGLRRPTKNEGTILEALVKKILIQTSNSRSRDNLTAAKQKSSSGGRPPVVRTTPPPPPPRENSTPQQGSDESNTHDDLEGSEIQNNLNNDNFENIESLEEVEQFMGSAKINQCSENLTRPKTSSESSITAAAAPLIPTTLDILNPALHYEEQDITQQHDKQQNSHHHHQEIINKRTIDSQNLHTDSCSNNLDLKLLSSSKQSNTINFIQHEIDSKIILNKTVFTTATTIITTAATDEEKDSSILGTAGEDEVSIDMNALSYKTSTFSKCDDASTIITPCCARVKNNDLQNRIVEDVKMAIIEYQNDTLEPLTETPVVSLRVSPAPEGASPLALPAAMQLKTVILGDSESYFPSTWREEGISFNSTMPYGLELHEEGPSGVLAALQGFVLKALLFGGCGTAGAEEVLSPSPEQAKAALVAAVSDVLWQCGQHQSACLAISCGEEGAALLSGQGRYRRDGVTEGLAVLHLDGGLAAVREAVERHLHRLQGPGGCALLLCSVVLSRGLSGVSEDMGDACAALLAEGGECAPELVSLVLTGRATMRHHVRNSCSSSSRGRLMPAAAVPARADVGLLALAEHYGRCQVGSFLKTPRYPIWLVLAHGRYSLLFSTRRQLVSDWRAELAFRLHLYKGAGRQNRPLQLAVATGGETTGEEEKPLTAVEMVVRTKWTGASVTWVGEPDLQL